MKRHGYTSARPDVAAEEMIAVLLNGEVVDFHSLFATVQENLRARSYTGGADMLRLRVYETLQKLATQGLVEKSGKTYTPVVQALTRRAAAMEKAREDAAMRKAAKRSDA